MSIFEEIFIVSHRLSELHPDRPREFIMMKIIEEMGEMADAISPFNNPEPLEGEIADFIICLGDLFYFMEQQLGADEGEQADTLSMIMGSYGTCFSGDVNEDYILQVLRMSPMRNMSDNIFRKGVVSNIGDMARAINQPGRSELYYANYMMLALESAINLLWKEKCSTVNHNPEALFNILKRHVKTKLAKWKSKAGI